MWEDLPRQSPLMGAFRLGGLPGGNIVLQLSGATGPFDLKGYVISRIERDGVPMPRGIEVKDGEHVGGIRVVVAYGNGSIRGVVKLGEWIVACKCPDVCQTGETGGEFFRLRPSQIDSRGNFLMEGIPPGNYELRVQFFGAGSRADAPAQTRSECTEWCSDGRYDYSRPGHAAEAVNAEQTDATVYCSNCPVRSCAGARATWRQRILMSQRPEVSVAES